MFGRLASFHIRETLSCPVCGTHGYRAKNSRRFSISTDQQVIDGTQSYREVPRGYWVTTKNQRSFFEWIEKELNITSLDQWYSVTTAEIDKRGGQAMLNNCFQGSLYRAMKKLYPQHDWKPWLFQRLPAKFWNEDQHVVDYLQWLSKQLGISKLDDWYLVSNNQVSASLLKHRGPLSHILKHFYPNHPWKFTNNTSLLGIGLGNAQQHLVKLMQSLFPSEETFVNYKHPELMFSKSGVKMEFDVFIPSLNLACEYLGEQHYQYHFMFGSYSSVQERDKEKQLACKEHGITYVPIPFWWDRTKNSLVSTLKTIRPDLLPNLPLTEPIPLRVPSKRSYKRALQLATAQKWNPSQVPDNWWAIPIPEGLRLWWDGESAFLSNGKVVLDSKNYPAMKSVLPAMPLDVIVSSSTMEPAELWNAMASKSMNLDTNSLKFFILDAPAEDHLRYEERMKLIKEKTHPNDQVKIVEGTQCKNQQHLDSITNEAKTTMDKILLRQPNSHYYEPNCLQVIHLKFNTFDVAVISQTSPEIKCLLPNMKPILPKRHGDRSRLHVGTVVYLSQKQPAEIVQIVPEESWETILQTEYPYKLSYGTQRKEPQCRGCRKVIPKKTLRIEVAGTYSPTNLGPHPANYSVCLNMKCLEQAQNPALYTRSGIGIPKFRGVVRVPSEVKDSLPNMPNVNWVRT